MGCQSTTLSEVKSLLADYQDNETARASLYSQHKQLGDVFDFFNTEVSSKYALITDVDQESIHENQELLVFEVFDHKTLGFVLGRRQKLQFQSWGVDKKDLVCRCNGKLCRLNQASTLIFVRVGGQITRDIALAILQSCGQQL